MGSIDPRVRVIDKEILDTLLAHIEQMLDVLPRNVTQVDFTMAITTRIEPERGGYWAHDHKYDYKDVIEEMVLNARFEEPADRPFLTRITFVYIDQILDGTVSIRLLLTPPNPAPVE